jgi:ubiquinone/menaquinone biosynthesis C-methylase UbiE
MKDDELKPGGSGILPEETPPKFFARHLSAYHFAIPYIKNKDVLEIGFGDGYGAYLLAGIAKEVKAVDILEKNVRLAEAKYNRGNLKFIQTPSSVLDFREESFDIVVSFQVIEHIPEDKIQEYLCQINRVLKKDGIAFISTLNLEKNKKPKRPYPKNPFHIKEFTYEELDDEIKEVFKEYKISGLFYTKKLIFYERLKKLGLFRYLPGKMNIVDKFYNNITVKDFIWRDDNLRQCIDFMVVCKKSISG